MIQLDAQLPDFVLNFWEVRIGNMAIDGKAVLDDADCASPETWVLDKEQKLLVLCPTVCTQFDTAGVLQTGWDYLASSGATFGVRFPGTTFWMYRIARWRSASGGD